LEPAPGVAVGPPDLPLGAATEPARPAPPAPDPSRGRPGDNLVPDLIAGTALLRKFLAEEKRQEGKVVGMFWPPSFLPIPRGWFNGYVVRRTRFASVKRKSANAQDKVRELIRAAYQCAFYTGVPIAQVLVPTGRRGLKEFLRMKGNRSLVDIADQA